jgi:hypothetical protein
MDGRVEGFEAGILREYDGDDGSDGEEEDKVQPDIQSS